MKSFRPVSAPPQQARHRPPPHPPPPPFDTETMEPLETPRQATKQWIPMRNRISFGSSVPGNPSEPNPNGFDQRPLGKAPEIQLDDGRDSGSRIQRREGLWHPVCDPIRKIAAKIISLHWSEELRSPRMKISVKSTNSAKSVSGVFSSFENFRFHRFRFIQIPPQPLFPCLPSGEHLFQRPSPQKQFPSNQPHPKITNI